MNRSGIHRLNALVAGVAELDGSLRAPALRQYLEYGLERLQLLEEEHFAFLGECAQLAADNLQDLRLQDLEQRVAKLEAPDGPAWGETLTGIATNFALQVTVLLALEAAVAGGILAVAGIGALGPAIRQARQKSILRSASDRARSNKAISDEALATLGEALERLLGGRVPPGGFPILTANGAPAKIHDVRSWVEHAFRTGDTRDASGAAMRLTMLSVAAANNDAKVTRVLAAYQRELGKRNDAAIARFWPQWRDFIGSEQGGLALDPAFAVLDRARQAAFGSRGKGTAGSAFQSSTITGRYLNWTRNERLRIAETYANLRLLVRYAPDSALTRGDAEIQFLALLVAEILPQWEVLQAYAQGARPWIVRGFEAAFWHDYLRSNGALVVARNHELSIRDRSFRPGQLFNGHLILEVMPEDPRAHYRTNVPGNQRYLTDYYAGAALLTDLQAEHLFHQFAKPFFESAENRQKLLPFRYDPTAADRYANLTALKDDWFWGTPNPERLARMGEMRFMVLVFFNELRGIDFSERLKQVLQLGSALSIEDWIDEQPEGIVPDIVDPVAETEEARTAGAAAFQAKLTQTSFYSDDQLEKAELALTDTITVMHLLLLHYSLLAGESPIELIGLPSGATAESVAGQIDALKSELKERYDQVQQLAGSDPAKARTVTERFHGSVDSLLHWSPGANGGRAPAFGERFRFKTEDELAAP